MKERPILFSGPMVRAILNGRKSQTRRIVKPQCDELGYDLLPQQNAPSWRWCGPSSHGRCDFWGGELNFIFCPYGQPGDRLWVKESLHATYNPRGEEPIARYSSDTQFVPATEGKPALIQGEWRMLRWQWKRNNLPSIFMPRFASRLTLEVAEVRVERLREICEEDAIAEGIVATHNEPGERIYWRNYRFKTAHPRKGTVLTDEEHRIHAYGDRKGGTVIPDQVGAIRSYQSLWESINGVGSWDANPFVWVITFRRIE